MDVAVDHIREQVLRARRRLGFSFAGDSFIDRARSTTLGLLGAMAAVGLSIVVIAANQGWPLAGGNPIPGSIGDNGTSHVSPAVGLTEAVGPGVSAPHVAAASPAPGAATAHRRQGPGSGAAPGRGPDQVVSDSAPVISAPVKGTASPPPPESVPVAAPVSEPPPSTTSEEGSGRAKGRSGSGATTEVTSGTVGSSRGGGPGTGSSRGRGSERSASGAPSHTPSRSADGHGASEAAPGHGGTVPGNAFGREGTPPGQEAAAAPGPGDTGSTVGSGHAGDNGHGPGGGGRATATEAASATPSRLGRWPSFAPCT
jgi:hypothetical protein